MDDQIVDFHKELCLKLAANADINFDEHGSKRGMDYLKTIYVSYVPFPESLKPPYFDSGCEGLGLVMVKRKRVYRGSKWSPKSTHTMYLVGKNECGTYFSHAVPQFIKTVYSAVQWIWRNKANKIVVRQGDIALVRGPFRETEMPAGHKLEGDYILHSSHPAIPKPRKGERIIVGRRAIARVSEETRD